MLGKTKMIKALQKLKILTHQTKQPAQDEFATLKISGGKSRLVLFQTHPDINDRIHHLEQLRESSMKI
jgi:Zn-dependent protease with chaperone function